jgi:lysophospholipase L1-like esterase
MKRVQPWRRVVALSALAGLLAAELLLRRRADPARWATPTDRLPPSFQSFTWEAVLGRRRVVVLGDSIAAGAPTAPSAAWPELVQQQLDGNQPGAWAIINASVPGETALQGLLRVERDVLRWHPHLVLIAFGLNDGRLAGPTPADLWRRELLCRGYLQPGPLYLFTWLRGQLRAAACRPDLTADPFDLRRSPPAEYRQALRLSVEKMRQADPKTRIMLINLTPIGPACCAGRGADEYAQQVAAYEVYNAAVHDLVTELDVEMIDVLSPLRASAQATVLQDDGLHLTTAGQTIVAAVVVRRISKLNIGRG